MAWKDISVQFLLTFLLDEAIFVFWILRDCGKTVSYLSWQITQGILNPCKILSGWSLFWDTKRDAILGFSIHMDKLLYPRPESTFHHWQTLSLPSLLTAFSSVSLVDAEITALQKSLSREQARYWCHFVRLSERPKVPLPVHSWGAQQAEESRFSRALPGLCPTITATRIFPTSETWVSLKRMSILLAWHIMNAQTSLLETSQHYLVFLESKREVGKGVAALQSAKWPTAPQWEAQSYVAH